MQPGFENPLYDFDDNGGVADSTTDGAYSEMAGSPDEEGGYFDVEGAGED